MNMKIAEMNFKNQKKIVDDIVKKEKYIEYPEEILPLKMSSQVRLKDLLKKNESLKEKFSTGVSY